MRLSLSHLAFWVFALGLAAAMATWAIFARTPTIQAIAGPPEGNDDCPNGLIDAGKIGELKLARVVTDGPVHFQANGCADNALHCELKSIFDKGDRVFTGPDRGGWTCVSAARPNFGMGLDGWLRSEQLAAITDLQEPRSSDWHGEWDNGRWFKGGRPFLSATKIMIRARGKDAIDLNVENIGSTHQLVVLANDVRPIGDALELGGRAGQGHANACQASLRLLMHGYQAIDEDAFNEGNYRYLIVSNKSICDDLDVDLSGIYMAKPPQPPMDNYPVKY